ncbi:MAG: hypothetical protein HYY07_03235, partial [Elusimicrobia bacterium]|nr:hypothetical protein [Elusimicrobiota bacterium]
MSETIHFCTIFFALFLLVLMISVGIYNGWSRLAVWFLAAASIVACAVPSYRSARKKMTIPSFSKIMGKKSSYFQEIQSAIELNESGVQEGVSPDMQETFIQGMQSALEKHAPSSFVLWENLKKKMVSLTLIWVLTFLFLVLPPQAGLKGWNQLVRGTESEIARFLRIFPQGGDAPFGEPVEISIQMLQSGEPAPNLSVRVEDRWEDVAGQKEGSRFFYKLNALTEKLLFRVRWKNLHSPVYTLTPVETTQLIRFKSYLEYPEYTSKNPETLEGPPQFQTLRGTKVTIQSQSTRPLKQAEIVTADGRRFPTRTQDSQIEASLTVRNPIEFWFEWTDSLGNRPTRNPHYVISIAEDRSPSVRLLSPASDILASRETRIPFSFEAADDMGVVAVSLKAGRKGSARFERFLLRRYKTPSTLKIDSVEFPLSALRPIAGEILQMELEVEDNDRITGPKRGASASILVEIQNYEKSHEKIEKDLETFRKDLLQILAEQTLAKVLEEKWNSISADAERFQRQLDESVLKQAKVSSKTQKLEQDLDRIVSEMENDPYSDPRLWNEHRAIKKSLNELKNGAMTQAQNAFAEKQWQEAVTQQDNSIAELERLATLSEEIYKYGKMKDLMDSAGRLEEKGRILEDNLTSGEPLDSKMVQLLQDTLQEASRIISEIQKQIRQLPQDLPEDFVNQESVKSLNIVSMQKSAQSLSQALQSGNLQAALQAAKELLQEARKAQETLSKAFETTTNSDANELDKKMSLQFQTLKQLIQRQEKILQPTAQLENKQSELLDQKQKKILSDLTHQQKKILDAAKNLSNTLSSKDSPQDWEKSAAGTLQTILPVLEKIWKEMNDANVTFSQKWLSEIVPPLDSAEKDLQRHLSMSQST